MKKFKLILASFIALFVSFSMTSCSDDDDNNSNNKTDDDPTLIKDFHFDLWVALDRHGGMGRDVTTLVRSLDNLDADQPIITFEKTGVEINQKLSLETILKGAYYYQVPVDGDRFGKYRIEDNTIEVVAERPFKKNVFSTRKYTHAWINDNTLIIMAADGSGKNIIWTKLNADDLTIDSEGTLDIPMPEKAKIFTTSGILTYRKSDNKLFYFYYAKSDGKRGKRVTPMMTAVINPDNMAVESNTGIDFMDCEMVGTAYGELLQTTSFIDDHNNLYLACVTDEADGSEKSHLLRINANSTSFDPSYDGFTAGGKLISVMYMGGNNVMAYARDDQFGTGIDDFSHYYTVIDIATKTASPVMYEGQRLAFSSGRFSSRMAYVNHKAYIGIDAKDVNPQIYIYDAITGLVVKGVEMKSGYFFEQIRVVEGIK
ncbi:MAG: hypothetical protein NC339_08885 [Muribaculaceae bacterium]|nr:hypothetical protein [Muribaculaceae bacterium]